MVPPTRASGACLATARIPQRSSVYSPFREFAVVEEALGVGAVLLHPPRHNRWLSARRQPLGLGFYVLGEERLRQDELERPALENSVGIDHEIDEPLAPQSAGPQHHHDPHADAGAWRWRRADELDDVQVALADLAIGEGQQVDVALGADERARALWTNTTMQ